MRNESPADLPEVEVDDDMQAAIEAVVLRMFYSGELSLEVEGGGFTNPNSREISVVYHDHAGYKNRVLCTAYLDVVQTREYEG